MMADVISGVMQMQKTQSLKDYTTKELEIELARRWETVKRFILVNPGVVTIGFLTLP